MAIFTLTAPVVSLYSDLVFSSFQAALTAAAGKTLNVHKDWIITGSNPVAAPNTKIIGAGGSITLGEDGRRGVVLDSGCEVSGIDFVGHGLTVGTSLDAGIYASSGKRDILIHRNSFRNFGGSTIHIENGENCEVSHNTFEQNIGPSDGAVLAPEVYFAAGCKNIRCYNNTGVANTDPAKRKSLMFFFAAFVAGHFVDDVDCSKNNADGYFRGLFSATDEAPQAAFEMGLVSCNGNIIRNSGGSAIKFKNISYYSIQNNQIFEYETEGPELLGTLQGGILANAGGNATISGNKLRTTNANSTYGIMVIALPDVVTPSPDFGALSQTRTDFTVSGNQVYGASVACYVGNSVSNMSIDGLTARNCGAWIRIEGIASLHCKTLSINGGSFRNVNLTNPATGHPQALQASYVDGLTVDGQVIDGSRGDGAAFINCTDVSVGGQVINSGIGGVVGYGVQFNDTTDFKFTSSIRNSFQDNLRITGTGVNAWIDGDIEGELIEGLQVADVLDQNSYISDAVRGQQGGFAITTAAPSVYLRPDRELHRIDGTTNITDITGPLNGHYVQIVAGTSSVNIIHDTGGLLINLWEGDTTLTQYNVAGRSSMRLWHRDNGRMEQVG